ncbi:hypothetical protein N658DRAFT_560092 [Parathielavia hyrcaniae]|uniref:Protein phosphatase n=1 Tax=Parathielavia hyrcaniae TaxID=113614 RepID=A0AAN6Q2H0_9PEZI|nr:hypothetical protein N658DRAFT_560092 [Parathielavia hyrcaniae]
MRRPAARLLAPASHASLRVRAAQSSIATHAHARVRSAPLPPLWLCPSRLVNDQLLLQKRWISWTASKPRGAPSAAISPRSSPAPDEDGRLDSSVFANHPFRFDTGIALFAKRTPRPFPPPFLSPPSGSFSDPLSTHDRSRDRRRAYVGGQLIQGFTNGDDAVFASDYFIGANDGVGAWSTRPRGHAGLWARLILHFWATSMFEDAARQGNAYRPDPVAYLQRAYEQTIEATGPPNDWQGTTTAAGAQLHYRRVDTNSSTTTKNNEEPAFASSSPTTPDDGPRSSGKPSDDDATQQQQQQQQQQQPLQPLLYVTNLGDSQVMVVRPSSREMVYKSAEQWHWFDCPRQLGTNSPDTPRECAVVDAVALREGDVVLAMSDGVIDNLWAHEIVDRVCDSLESSSGMMGFVAEELMEAARAIAVDPFAESPFMEHAIEEGLASVGGKLDDISVVAAICRRNGP